MLAADVSNDIIHENNEKTLLQFLLKKNNMQT